MQNGRRNRVGRQECFRFGVPPVSACPACFCRSLPARACPSFLFGQSRQQMVSFRCRGIGFPACRMRNGQRNRVGRTASLPLRCPACPRLSRLPLSVSACPCLSEFFKRAESAADGFVSLSGHRFSGLPDAERPEESGRAAAPLSLRCLFCLHCTGGDGKSPAGWVATLLYPPHTSGQRTGSHRRHLLPRDVWRERMCGCAWRGREWQARSDTASRYALPPSPVGDG